jgi:PAS domain S-box-containing protein
MLPVPALANTNASEKTTATIVGLRTISNDLYPLLNKEIFSTNSDTSILVRQDQGSVVYLNKPNTNNSDMFMRLPRDPDKLAAAYALDNPGTFAIRQNFSGKEVLFVSRQIPDSNWLLLQMISTEEALRDSDAHHQSLITSFSLGLAALVFIIVAFWRHGASLYAQQYASVLEEKSTLLAEQRNLLESITENIGDLIVLVDSNLHIQFSNTPVASIYQLKPADLIGKTLSAALGSEIGKILEGHLQSVRDTGLSVVSVHEFSFNDALHTYHGSFLPVGEDSILIVLHDITALKNAQEKHDRLMKHLVQTLTHVIDSYDPNCANHSAKTTKIALAIGREMNLSQDDIETLELSANLANIGKLFIPKEILTKTTELTPDERTSLQTTINLTVDILVDLDFDGPVLETIAQKNEHMDGSGYPRGLTGEDILMTARILAVANAFAAMHSPRAYRAPLPTDEILHSLYEDSGKLYDKHVVAALMHVAENKLDWL